ncbi:6-phosphofructokinase [uncultured Ilyobacter sp.]|uniref:6-phosphofructokinase n=1 Tax=uncultured Ilyobacter sp. TaxID=544433 RepID=UPI0029C96709|nr:6-phosphofructokinase [uncultured Ilyobacter sp.]
MNILVAQSGGPTAAINATIAGVIEEAQNYKKIKNVYGALNGIEGVINKNLVSFDEIDIELLFKTPSSALGSCRYKLPTDLDNEIYPKIISYLKEKDIRCFIYVGGNDSMDTVLKLSNYCKKNKIEDISIIGAPKTIDNDLMGTDHCPGFGSAAKYVATTFLELEKDCSVYNQPSLTLVEVMGRNSGWLIAASALSKLNGGEGPSLIYLCEEPFKEDRFLEDVGEKLTEGKPVLVALSEGLKDLTGKYIGGSESEKTDNFGHVNSAGAGKYLENLVKKEMDVKVRSIELNIMQRCSGHITSKRDLDESKMLGQEALKLALENKSGRMVGLKRLTNIPYQVEVINTSIQEIANLEKKVPLKWISSSKNYVEKELINYIKPLIEGEVEVDYENGIPKYFSLKKY